MLPSLIYTEGLTSAIQILSEYLDNAPNMPSRYGNTKEIIQIGIAHTNPKSRLMGFKSRKENLVAQIAETLWVLGGSNKVNYIQPFLPRAIEFSDNSEEEDPIWRSGYGARIRNYPGKIDQVKSVINILKNDLYSRRAFLSILYPPVDQTPGKDIACNNTVHFLVRKDSEDNKDKLYMTVDCRSNDCFTYDTKIPLLDGTECEIGKLAEERANDKFWVYSNDHNGNLVPGLAHHPRYVKHVSKLIEVTLDNDSITRCTPDHKWMLRDGTYKEAQHLKKGDSLMPLYRKLDKRGYEKILDLKNNRYIATHTIINNLNKLEFEEILEKVKLSDNKKVLVTHHKDFNKRNNCPDNLQWMGWDEHRKFHQNLIKDFNNLLWNSENFLESRNRVLEGLKRGNKTSWSKEGRKGAQTQVMRDVNFKMWSDPEFREKMKPIQSIHGKELLTKLWKDPEFRKRVSEESRRRLSTPERVEQTKMRLRQVNVDPEFKEKQRLGRLKKKENPEYLKRLKENHRNGKTELTRTIAQRVIRDLNLDPNNSYKAVRGKIIKVLNFLYLNKIGFSEENYTKTRKNICRNAKNFIDICNYNIENHEIWNKEIYDNECKLIQEKILKKNKINVINHKVKSIKVLEVEPTPVYDLTVDEYHNFALSSGVYVSNCIWGYSGINYFEFTFIQEFIANQLGIEVGTYLHNVMSFHIYEHHFDKMKSILQETLEHREDVYCPPIEFESLEVFDNCFNDYKNCINTINSFEIMDVNIFISIWKEFKSALQSSSFLKSSQDSTVYFEIPILFLLCQKSKEFRDYILPYLTENYFSKTELFYQKISKIFGKLYK